MGLESGSTLRITAKAGGRSLPVAVMGRRRSQFSNDVEWAWLLL